MRGDKRENMNTEIMFSSKKQDWTTPKDFFNKLNSEFKFTLDPCCYKETALCEKFFTEKENGLIQDWSKDIVFCNPPYGRETHKWVKKSYEESLKGATVVMLIPARPDVSYFHEIIMPYASEIRFVKGRLKFGNSKNAAPFPSVVVVFGGEKKGISGINK